MDHEVPIQLKRSGLEKRSFKPNSLNPKLQAHNPKP